jgi:two-component system CheB/CheR fusion protein
VGASAGGLESLGRLLAGLPQGFPAPILVVLHLDPHHRSQAVFLLQHRTRLRVESARGGTHVQAGTVYVAPPDHHLEIHAGRLRLTHAARVNYSRPSIDTLFASVAEDYGPAAIVAVLSGTGRDGAAGVVAVKAQGGLAVAEAASTATFPYMPAAAGRTGLLDAVLPVEQIATFLRHSLGHSITVSKPQWLRILALLESRTGATFSKYRSTTLHRRLRQRLAARGCRTMAAYLRLLEEDDTEVSHLQAAFLIKVSAFMRDPATWRFLARRVAPLASQGTRGVRVWSAGCATGEEAYTLALLLAHVLGIGPDVHWKVFATDLDEGALKVARAGLYSDDQVRGVSKADLAHYFVREGSSWRVGKPLRSRMVFGRHDLLHDAPLSGMDVLACRNVLIYFAPQEKQRTLHRLSFAVKPGGILFLGRSEALGPLPGFDRLGNHTLFQRRTLQPAMPAARKRAPATDAPTGRGAAAPGGLLGNSTSVVALSIDAKDKVLLWNRAAETFFGKAAKQAMGKTLSKLVGNAAARHLKAVMKGKVPGQAIPVGFHSVDGPRLLEVECLAAAPPAVALFLGVQARQDAVGPSPSRRVGPIRPAGARRLTAEARLLAQQDLNDELQSRNEELETVNEELQSLNDAMSAMEDEMRSLGEESRRANEFLRLLLDTSSDVLIACDADNRVAFWNKAAIKQYGLSPAQAVGHELFDLVPALGQASLQAASRKIRAAGRDGGMKLTQDSTEYVFDPILAGAGRRRSYLLRVRSKPS